MGEISVDHDIGKSIDIKSNGFGGIEIFVSRQANSNGAWDMHAYTKKGGKKMMNYDLITSLTNDATQFKFGLTGDLTVDPASVLFKNVISNYKILTPFNKRHGEIEIFLDKQNKNAVLNKFMIHGKTEKDGQQALDVLADFTKSPYEIKIFAPVIRNLIGSLTTGSEGILITLITRREATLRLLPISKDSLDSRSQQVETRRSLNSMDRRLALENSRCLATKWLSEPPRQVMERSSHI